MARACRREKPPRPWRGFLVLLGDESRLRIVLTLAQDGEATVAALAATVGQSRSNVSHNLSRLLLAGQVSCRPEGRNHFYQMEWGEFRDVLGRFFAEAGDAGREVHLGSALWPTGPVTEPRRR